jgi:hypothetical protein
MNRSIYLDAITDGKFKAKCQELGVTEGEAIQKSVQLLISTPTDLQFKECLNCQYYQMAQAEVFETMKRLHKVTDLFMGNLLKKKTQH